MSSNEEGITIDNKKICYLILGVPESATPYEVLGVGKNATSSQIRNRYRNLMKKYHPDTYSKSTIEEIFKILAQIPNNPYTGRELDKDEIIKILTEITKIINE